MSRGVLLITSIMPSSAGPGLAMRADRIARALALRDELHLRVIPLQDLDPHAPPPWPPGLRVASRARVWTQAGLLHRIRHRRTPERARLSPQLGDLLRDSLEGLSPRVVLVLRHALTPLAVALRRTLPTARYVLDLDELESHTRGRMVTLRRLRGERRAADALVRQVADYRHREQRELPRFDQLWVSSHVEAERVEKDLGLRPRVVPNTVDPPPTEPSPDPPGVSTARQTRETLLFVGGLGYLPNRDAVEWCAREILPAVRAAGRPAAVLRVVGRVPREVKRRVGHLPGLELAGSVDTLGSEYREAALCVVPLRAGGGTRIKLLEALAHGRAVVSTSLGAEGLDLDPGKELLVADSAGAFARACVRVLEERDLARDLAHRGRARVTSDYGAAALAAAIDSAWDALA